MIRLNFLPAFVEARILDFPVPREWVRIEVPHVNHQDWIVSCCCGRKNLKEYWDDKPTTPYRSRKVDVRMDRCFVAASSFGREDMTLLLFHGVCRAKGCRTGYYDCRCVDPDEAAILAQGGVLSG